MRCGAVATAFALLAVPAPSFAQQAQPPVVENAPPVVQNAPPVIQNQLGATPATQGPVVQNQPGPAAVPPPVVENRPPAPPPVVTPVPTPANSRASRAGSYPEVAVEPEAERGRAWSGAVFLAGLGLYIVSYGITALVGAAISDPDGDLLFWPVVGPMLYYDRVEGHDSDLLKAALLSTIAQSLGVILAIYGFFEMLADDR